MGAIHPLQLGVATSFLVVGEAGRCVLVDAGEPGKGRAFEKGMARLGIDPRRIELLVITHGHWDHVGSARAIHERTGAPVAMHVLDRHSLELGRPGPPPPGITSWGKLLSRLLGPLTRFVSFPAMGVQIPLGLDELDLRPYGVAGRVIHTPGHSPGSVSVVLETGEALVGDMAMNGPPMRIGPGLPSVAEVPAQLVPSWRKLLALDIRTVYPAHGHPFPAEVMRRCVGSKVELSGRKKA